jgi:hypothetical protein
MSIDENKKVYRNRDGMDRGKSEKKNTTFADNLTSLVDNSLNFNNPIQLKKPINSRFEPSNNSKSKFLVNPKIEIINKSS